MDQSATKAQSISVLFDIAKFDGSRWKNAAELKGFDT